jgi:hypothetical protein
MAEGPDLAAGDDVWRATGAAIAGVVAREAFNTLINSVHTQVERRRAGQTSVAGN